ncbi:MAG: hypothetical protein ACREDF_11685, partial [Thermoplasmata archaeon]
MGAARPAPLALVLFLLLLWGLLPPVLGQPPEGHLTIATDYELFGTSDLRGGGHVTWTLTGAKAADLRAKILHLFDEYPSIPSGFPFGHVATTANQDGRLDAGEGVGYTNLLENVLEASGRGTNAQYMQLFPFDLRDKAGDESTNFRRSTSGLAGTDVNATADVEIRFLFEANITKTDARVPLATRSLVDALYRIFSYRTVQASNLTTSGAWPFLAENGWRVVTETRSGLSALWAGNTTTGLYDDNTDATSRTIADPAFASIDPAYEPFDFRFASRARATFNYTGLLGAGDSLQLEYAHWPAYTDWTNLSFDTGATLRPSPNSWSNATVDLTPVLGERVRLRFHFQSNATGSDRGIFLRDFAIDAPAVYAGQVVESDTHYLIGTLSFSDPAVTSGGIHLIRTPGGELLMYGVT